MNILFNNQYLEMLYEFMAKGDIRYYLNGFHIKPHSEQGVVLTATDGHRLVTIHDKDGFSDGEFIFPISKGLLSASKKKGRGIFSSKNIIIIKGKALVNAIEYSEFPLDESILDDGEFVSYIEFIKPIDGQFPVASRIFKGLGEPKPTKNIGLNTHYLTGLNKLTSMQKFGAVSVYLYSPDNAILAVAGLNREIVAMIMPARLDKLPLNVPEFVFECGRDAGQPQGVAA
ncbi:hypothetical protein ACRWQN_17700 [Shewanella sp. HL-SH8]|uniref:hypothetical protein n=1 Tax=Shewanella sp. HL-SH8 TaxID=3436242 RepID=UPI003EBED526